MIQKDKKTSLMFVLATAGIGLVVPAAFGSSVSLDTTATGSGWTVSGGGAAFPLGTNVVQVTTLPASWILASTINGDQNVSDLFNNSHNAAWVSTSSDGTSAADVNGSKYVYDKAFTLDSDSSNNGKSESLTLTGTFSVDNWVPANSNTGVAGVTLTYGSTVYNVPFFSTGGPATGNEMTYMYALTLADFVPSFISPQNFNLDVAVINSYGDTVAHAGQNPGPAGLILAGTATSQVTGTTAPVPLPASAGVGFSMMAGFGLLAALRKRVMRSSRIV